MRLKLATFFVLVAFLAFTGAALAGQAASPPAKASFDEKAVADFYRGKTVRIIVGFSPGGGYDQYSRVIARHLSKYVPGNPNVLVDNMPGVGSIIAANNIYNAAPKDGTVIGNISGPIVLEQLFGAPSVQYDMGKFRYIAVPVKESYMMIVHKRAGVTKLDQLRGDKAKQVTFGAIPGSTVEHAPVLMKEALNVNLKIVSGYKGTADVRLALDGGEVDGFFNTWTSSKVTSLDKVKSGEWVILAQLCDTPMKDLIVPNVPTIPMIAKSEEQRLLLKYGTSTPNDFGKVYVLPPGTPPDRAQAIEAAFAAAMKDKDLMSEAHKGNLDFDPLFGTTIQKLVVEFLGMPTDIKNKLQAILIKR
jgi:tripartite-type tricarboxylate transporter receptor subunit TctC